MKKNTLIVLILTLFVIVSCSKEEDTKEQKDKPNFTIENHKFGVKYLSSNLELICDEDIDSFDFIIYNSDNKEIIPLTQINQNKHEIKIDRDFYKIDYVLYNNKKEIEKGTYYFDVTIIEYEIYMSSKELNKEIIGCEVKSDDRNFCLAHKNWYGEDSFCQNSQNDNNLDNINYELRPFDYGFRIATKDDIDYLFNKYNNDNSKILLALTSHYKPFDIIYTLFIDGNKLKFLTITSDESNITEEPVSIDNIRVLSVLDN